MKLLFQDYTFNAAAKQITFNTSDTVALENVLLITNVTDNQIIYNFANPAQGGSISNNVLTLTFDTTAMSNTDSLQVFLDLGGASASDDGILLLRRIVQLLSPLATQDANQRQRIAIDTIAAGTTLPAVTTVSGVTTVTTVSTVSNVAAMGGVDPRFQFIDAARLTYAQGIRSNLSFS